MINFLLDPYFLPLINLINQDIEYYNLSISFNMNHFVLVQNELFKVHRNYSVLSFSTVYKIYTNNNGFIAPLGVCSSYQQIQQITGFRLNIQIGNLEFGQFHEVASLHFPIKFRIETISCSEVSSIIDISSLMF
jgi:hypothetical protein